MSEKTELAPFIQSTLVAPGVTAGRVREHCEESAALGFDAAMVPGNWVGAAAAALAGTGVTVASAVDFPMGIMSTRGRIAEAVALVEDGAEELDIGFPVGWLRSGLRDAVEADLAAVVSAVAPVPVKVMLELPLLTADEREIAVQLSVDAGVTWLKNASSRQVGVATVEDIAFLAARSPDGVRVKASGGIDTREHVVALLDAGADLVGTSSGAAIVAGAPVTTTSSY